MENENDISNELVEDMNNGMKIFHGSMGIDGNLKVDGQIKTENFNLANSGTGVSAINATPTSITIDAPCSFSKVVGFNNGKTLIGIEKKYNSAYVGSPTIQVGDRLIFGDSSFKIETDGRTISADTYHMRIYETIVDILKASKIESQSIKSNDIKVTNELVANKLYADKISGKTFALENIVGINIKTSESFTTKNLIVNGFANVQNDITIQGSGAANGAALTVNGGEIVANKGIVSHTKNNKFQTMEIFGDGTPGNIGFEIDKDVSSLIQGNVTIQDANLILDNSNFVSDNVIIAPIETNEDITSGIQLTTKQNWDEYVDGMKEELPAEKSFEEEYDPYQYVQDAIQRNEKNYNSINEKIKTLLNPINYMMENNCQCLPKKFNLKKGLYRLDSNGNALMKNIVSENGTFSTLTTHEIKTNVLKMDKLVNTSVASNVIMSDQLMKSSGIAEFDGAIHSSADIFIEKDSMVNVAEGTKVSFQNGSSLKMKNGATLEMDDSTAVKMHGDIELDLSKLIFVDPSSGNKYKISFKDVTTCEGTTITVMEYSKITEETPREIVDMTSKNASELDMKLKSLGI